MPTETRLSSTMLVLVASIGASAQTAPHPTMPPGMTHEEHLAQMRKEAELKARGASAMGFDQDKTQHHFTLTPGGGAIEVIVRDRADQAVREQVRVHLKAIAADFAAGRFAKPSATHAEVPPGARIMELRKNTITYTYEEIPDGGRVLIATTDRRSKNAVHDFLRYQIREHATGDPTAIST